MKRIKNRLSRLTREMLAMPNAERQSELESELRMLQELGKAARLHAAVAVALPDESISARLEQLTGTISALKRPTAQESGTYTEELRVMCEMLKVWGGWLSPKLGAAEDEVPVSSLTWDTSYNGLRTDFVAPNKFTARQKEAIGLMDGKDRDKVLLLGGSGSGKSYAMAYKVIRDCLRHKAPCLIARDKFSDLSQGMVDQIIPSILEKIAHANGQPDWKKWKIDGIPFAALTERKMGIPAILRFATGGYIRFAGVSARDMSESGSDKILSPSWFHIMLEEVSELEYSIVEKLITRLRYDVPGELNKLLLCENPPSINHWSYKHFFEGKKADAKGQETDMGAEELSQQAYLMMAPKDNEENLGASYIRNLSQMTGANYERFYLGQFQDTESGEIFKRINWTEDLPKASSWDRLVIYTDPTPLTGKEHSQYADYKASVLCGLFDGMTFVLDVRIVKGSTMDMLQNIKQLWDISPNQSITEVWMEKKQVPSDFRQVMALFASVTGWLVPIRWDTRNFGDKKAAIETYLQPVFENDLIAFNQAFRNTERGRQTQLQVIKFSRKTNKMLHDDIPDAIMRADTIMKGRRGKKQQLKGRQIVGFVTPSYVQQGF